MKPKASHAAFVPLAKAASVAVPPAGYGDFLVEIKAQIRHRQYQAFRAANRE